MAFFNLWSSERLSFSLSIIAVVSAAITTYHQFHQEIDIAFQVGMPQSVPSHGLAPSYDSLLIPNEDTLSIPCTFVNSGTIPVGLTQSRVWMSVHDSMDVHRGTFGDQNIQNTIQTGVLENGTTGYFSPESVTQLQFNLNVDSISLARLLQKAPRGYDRHLYYGVSFDMISPDGNSTTASIKLGRLYYDTTTTCCVGSGGVGDILFAMPPFKPRQRIQLESD